MEMREIEAFLAVAEELHFGRAAARLRLSPSHVSQTVRRLERRVGTPLFERTSRRVVLTSIGEQLLADLGPAHQAIGRAMRSARRAADRSARKILQVGFTHSVDTDTVSAVVEEFARRRPEVRLVRSIHPSTLMAALFGATPPPVEADVMVGWVPPLDPAMIPSRLTVGPTIKESSRALLMAAKHPLATRTSVDIEELAGHPVLYPPAPPVYADAWSPPATPQGRTVRRLTRAMRFIDEMPDVLADGELLHITIATPPAYLKADLVTVPLTGLPPLRLTTVWNHEKSDDLFRLFADVAAAATMNHRRS